jgi:hypothetical protein
VPRASIQSVEALKDAKAALAEFTDAVTQTLASVDADINRVSQWLTQDRPAYWKAVIRRREDEVAKAHAAIMRKRIIAAPEPASVVEEHKAWDKAKRRLAAAQKKLDNVRRWQPIWEREALLYKTSCRGLAEAVHRDMPGAAARLESMMKSLDEYLRILPPQTQSDLPDALPAADMDLTDPGPLPPAGAPSPPAPQPPPPPQPPP